MSVIETAQNISKEAFILKSTLEKITISLSPCKIEKGVGVCVCVCVLGVRKMTRIFVLVLRKVELLSQCYCDAEGSWRTPREGRGQVCMSRLVSVPGFY